LADFNIQDLNVSFALALSVQALEKYIQIKEELVSISLHDEHE
jgi:hypothetical protein